MGCSACEEKRKRMLNQTSYYDSFESSSYTNRQANNSYVTEVKKDCEVQYKDLVLLYQEINKKKGIPSEVINAMRLQVTEWVKAIKVNCPDKDKYNAIKDKIYGTDLSTNKQE